MISTVFPLSSIFLKAPTPAKSRLTGRSGRNPAGGLSESSCATGRPAVNDPAGMRPGGTTGTARNNTYQAARQALGYPGHSLLRCETSASRFDTALRDKFNKPAGVAVAVPRSRPQSQPSQNAETATSELCQLK